jgi:hypothetical protein
MKKKQKIPRRNKQVLGDARYNSGIIIVYESKQHEAKLILIRSSVDHKKEKCSFKEKRKFNTKKNEK